MRAVRKMVDFDARDVGGAGIDAHVRLRVMDAWRIAPAHVPTDARHLELVGKVAAAPAVLLRDQQRPHGVHVEEIVCDAGSIAVAVALALLLQVCLRDQQFVYRLPDDDSACADKEHEAGDRADVTTQEPAGALQQGRRACLLDV
eukprot:7153952-Prymnesium_polylepis.1